MTVGQEKLDVYRTRGDGGVRNRLIRPRYRYSDPDGTRAQRRLPPKGSFFAAGVACASCANDPLTDVSFAKVRDTFRAPKMRQSEEMDPAAPAVAQRKSQRPALRTGGDRRVQSLRSSQCLCNIRYSELPLPRLPALPTAGASPSHTAKPGSILGRRVPWRLKTR